MNLWMFPKTLIARQLSVLFPAVMWATGSLATDLPLTGGYNHLPVIGASDHIPLAGAYGTPYACILYLAGGGWSVYKDMLPDGSTLPTPRETEGWPYYLLVTPEMIVTFEVACDVYSVAGERVTFRCTGGHTGDLEWVATVVEDKADKTLTYKEDDADFGYSLQLCLPPPVSKLRNPPEMGAKAWRDAG